MHLPDGASLHCRDALAWDRWSADHARRRDSLMVRAQQGWRWVTASFVVLVLSLAVAYRWGLPLAAKALLSQLPIALDETVGHAAMQALDEQKIVTPSTLPAPEQMAIREAFARALARLPVGTTVAYRLSFRRAPRIGPNAFALPGGTIVITDELVERVHGDTAMLTGVLGHELGHLRQRHGMRLLVQFGMIGATASVLYGDFSSMFALIPTWLAQASYNRDAERQADQECVRVLRAAGVSPLVMVHFFDLIRQGPSGHADEASDQPIMALASHPADAQRQAFFRQAASQR